MKLVEPYECCHNSPVARDLSDLEESMCVSGGIDLVEGRERRRSSSNMKSPEAVSL